jgi:Ca2+-binding RTX toxin-like protein
MLKGLCMMTAWLLAGTGTAHAATARVAAECDKYGCIDFVVYEAAAGERNVVSTERAGDALIVRDAGASISAGHHCAAIADGVRCTTYNYSGSAPGLHAFLGDGDDIVVATAPMGNAAYISGGRGDDRLTSGHGTLIGGPGNDVLTGSGVFHDADGDRPGRDIYRGTGIFDVLYYTDREEGVRVDLRAGHRSEDRISGVREVHGSPGDDVLIGDDSSNGLYGGEGRDSLIGLGGDDTLHLGDDRRHGGPDSADGGPGNDEITGGRDAARILCGRGEDEVSAMPVNRVAGDCELAAGAALHTRLSTTGTAILRALPSCTDCSTDEWTAKARGHVVAVASARIQPAHLRLNATGRRLLRRHRQLILKIERRIALTSQPERLVGGFTVRVRLP